MNNAFKIESKRRQLARNKEYKKLKLTYLRNFPEIEDINSPEFWNELNRNNIVSSKNNPMASDRINIICQLIPKGTEKILNIGFGSAQLEKQIFSTSQNFNWYGIDISNKSVEKASKLYLEAKFKIGSITNLEYQKSFFDCVIASEVLEHIKPSEIFKSLKEVKRVLKPKGYFIVSIPINEGLKKLVKNNNNPNGHVRVYSLNLIKAELEITSFKVIKTIFLYAFNKKYKLKTLIIKLLPSLKKPNNIIIIAQKP